MTNTHTYTYGCVMTTVFSAMRPLFMHQKGHLPVKFYPKL